MIVTVDTLHDVCSNIDARHGLGLDTETTGLTEDDEMFSLIITDCEQSYYFNFNAQAPETPPECILDKEEVILLLQPYFTNPMITWFIQNAKFDMRMLAKEEAELAGIVHCNYAIERVLKNNYFGDKAYSLAALAKRRGLEKDTKVDEYIAKHGLYQKITIPGKKKVVKKPLFTKVPFPIISEYGCQDGYLHRTIGLKQQGEAIEISRDTKYPTIFPVYNNEIMLTKTCFRMERRGILVDVPYTSQALNYEMGQVHEQLRAFKDFTGVDFTDSGKLLKSVFDRLGEKYPLTAKGNPSFTADALEEMETPVAKIINNIRYHEKRAGTYYSSFLYHRDQHDVLHADCRQAGTETGRMSYRDPNLQNVPKEDEEADQTLPFHVRECFIPRPGHFFYSIDYEQMEYRMMLDYAGEMKLIDRVMSGEDVHQATADMVGMLRKHAKTLNFAILYGAGIEKIAKMLGVSVREARELRATYFGRLPKVQKLIRQVIRAGEARGFVHNWFGRRCHIAQKDWAYVLPNHLIQGGCADVVKIAMNQVDNALRTQNRESRLLLQVHDELLVECPVDEADVVKTIVGLMENIYTPRNGMKLTTSVEHSSASWGYRHKIKGVYGG